MNAGTTIVQVTAAFQSIFLPSTLLRFQRRRRARVAISFPRRHSAEPLDLDGLAKVAGVSKYHFLRTFRRAVGISPYQFLLTFRMRQAALRLLTSSDSVTSVGFESGFGDLSTFNGHFRELFGLSPREYRER